MVEERSAGPRRSRSPMVDVDKTVVVSAKTAKISYQTREALDEAIHCMNGGQIDGLVILLEIDKQQPKRRENIPKSSRNRSPPRGYYRGPTRRAYDNYRPRSRSRSRERQRGPVARGRSPVEHGRRSVERTRVRDRSAVRRSVERGRGRRSRSYSSSSSGSYSSSRSSSRSRSPLPKILRTSSRLPNYIDLVMDYEHTIGYSDCEEQNQENDLAKYLSPMKGESRSHTASQNSNSLKGSPKFASEDEALSDDVGENNKSVKSCSDESDVVRMSSSKRKRIIETSDVEENELNSDSDKDSDHSSDVVENHLDYEVDDLISSSDDDNDNDKIVKSNSRRKSTTFTKRKGVPLHYLKCSKCGFGNRNKFDTLEGDPGRLMQCTNCPISVHKVCLPKNQHSSIGETYTCQKCLNNDVCGSCNEKQCDFPKINSNRHDVVEARNFDKSGLFFRCFRCSFQGHASCVFQDYEKEIDESLVDGNFRKCSTAYILSNWKYWDNQIETFLTWRERPNTQLIEIDSETPTTRNREYLVKFTELSHLHNTWVPEDWVKRVASIKLKSFLKRVEEENLEVSSGHYLKQTTDRKIWPKSLEDALPVEWVTIEKILDVDFVKGATISRASANSNPKKKKARVLDDDSSVDEISALEIDVPPVDDLEAVLIKWAGLSYEVCTWESYPHIGMDEDQSIEEQLTNIRLRKEIDVAYEKFVKTVELSYQTPNSNACIFKENLKQPKCIAGGQLKDYQLDGLNWLLFQWMQPISCILADVSFLSVLLNEHSRWPMLIIVPGTTIGNWERELSVWAPEMIVVAFGGTKVARNMIKLQVEGSKNVNWGKGIKCHVVIASYEHTLMDGSFYKSIDWEVMVCDEGHRLKNDEAKTFTAMNNISAKHRILLSGTPLQNNLSELYTLMSFLDPKKFGDGNKWNDVQNMDANFVQSLHADLKPYFLRRTKQQVLKDLPTKVEILLPVSLTKFQKKVYKAVLQRNSAFLLHIGAQNKPEGRQGKKETPIHNVLMELRKVCGHPYLLKDVDPGTFSSPEEDKKAFIDASGKLQLLNKLLPKLKEKGNRVLIFSQFKIVLNILEDFLLLEGYKFCRLDGDTPLLTRTALIANFNHPESDKFIFLLTTRTGGVGINLVSADTVIIYDADWNPQQDLQAIARAYRIGQTKPVVVYKLFNKGCVEERIIEIGRKKLSLTELIVERMDSKSLDKTELSSIIRFGAEKIFESSDDQVEDEKDIIRYDDAAIEKLVDRETLEHDEALKVIAPDADAPEGGEQKEKIDFSFSRIWNLEGNKPVPVEMMPNDLSTTEKPTLLVDDEEFWKKFLNDDEAIARPLHVDIGNTRRTRAVVNYSEVFSRGQKKVAANVEAGSSPLKKDSETEDEDWERGERESSPESVVSDNEETRFRQSLSLQNPGSTSTDLTNIEWNAGMNPPGVSLPKKPHQPTHKRPNLKQRLPQTQEHLSATKEAIGRCWLCASSTYHSLLVCPKKTDSSHIHKVLVECNVACSREADGYRRDVYLTRIKVLNVLANISNINVIQHNSNSNLLRQQQKQIGQTSKMVVGAANPQNSSSTTPNNPINRQKPQQQPQMRTDPSQPTQQRQVAGNKSVLQSGPSNQIKPPNSQIIPQHRLPQSTHQQLPPSSSQSIRPPQSTQQPMNQALTSQNRPFPTIQMPQHSTNHAVSSQLPTTQLSQHQATSLSRNWPLPTTQLSQNQTSLSQNRPLPTTQSFQHPMNHTAALLSQSRPQPSTQQQQQMVNFQPNMPVSQPIMPVSEPNIPVTLTEQQVAKLTSDHRKQYELYQQLLWQQKQQTQLQMQYCIYCKRTPYHRFDLCDVVAKHPAEVLERLISQKRLNRIPIKEFEECERYVQMLLQQRSSHSLPGKKLGFD